MNGVLTNFSLSIVKEVEIVVSNLFKNIKPRFFSKISDVDISRTAIRVMEEKGVLLSKESVMGVAAVLGGELTDLRKGR